MSARIVTCLDLPVSSAGGSVELFHDLYTGPQPLLPARAFMLAAPQRREVPAIGLETLEVTGRAIEGEPFRLYAGSLARALLKATRPADVDLIHLQHLAFGATPALIHAFPPAPQDRPGPRHRPAVRRELP